MTNGCVPNSEKDSETWINLISKEIMLESYFLRGTIWHKLLCVNCPAFLFQTNLIRTLLGHIYYTTSCL